MPQAVLFDLPQWILSHGLPVVSEGPWQQSGYRWVLNPCPWNSAHTNKSALSCSLPVALSRLGAITTAATATTGMRYGISASQGGRPARALQRSTSVATALCAAKHEFWTRAHVRTGAAGGNTPLHGQQAALDAVEVAQQVADALRQTLGTLADDAKEDAILDALPALAPLDTIAWMRLKRQLKAADCPPESE